MARPLLLAAVVLALAASGCDSFSRSGPATFAGTVVDAETAEPVADALVRVFAAGGAATTTTTDNDGTFALTVEADSTGQPYTLTVNAEDYDVYTATVRADVDDVTSLSVALDPEAGAPGVPPGVPTGPSGPATSITLDGRTAETVGVTGAGARETATLAFVAYDGQGRAVDLDHAVDLEFEIVSGPGGGESIDPTSATTDAAGRALVTLTSGERAGTVQVRATGTVEGREIVSAPVTITITGGLPDADHFSLAAEALNFAGYNRFGLTDAITAFVGDRFGNPVQPGTAVYFTTTGGIIGGSGVTDADGTASVNLLSAVPLPSKPFSCGGIATRSEGYATVTARTSDLGQQAIETTGTVLFSGVTEIDIAPLAIRLGAYNVTVADQFGHPLAPGTSISITADGTNIKTTGDASFVLGDFLCPGPGRTTFSIGVAQDNVEAGAEDPVLTSVSVNVTSPNGNARFTISGSSAARQRAPVVTFERY